MAYDAARGNALINRPMPHPLPANSVVAVVGANCGHCRNFLEQTNYPTRTEDGRTIVYVNFHSAEGRAYFNEHVSSHTTAGRTSFPIIMSTSNGEVSGTIASGPEEALSRTFPRHAAREAASGMATCSTDGQQLTAAQMQEQMRALANRTGESVSTPSCSTR